MLIQPSVFRLRTRLCHVVKTTVIISWNFLVNGFAIRAILSIMGMEMDIEVLLQTVFTIAAYGRSGHQNFAGPVLGCFAELMIIPFRTILS